MSRASEKKGAPVAILDRLFRDYLRERGLDLPDTTRLGLEALSPNQTAALGRGFAARMAMLIRYFGIDGKPLRKPPFYRIRYLGPLVGFDAATGKERRYIQPGGVGAAPYFPRIARTNWKMIANDPGRDLIITEGEMKAACATKLGFPTIGLGGVWNFKQKNQALLPELQAFEWDGRTVFIAYDSDATEKPLVRLAERRLAAALVARGANVRIMRLPDVL